MIIQITDENKNKIIKYFLKTAIMEYEDLNELKLENIEINYNTIYSFDNGISFRGNLFTNMEFDCILSEYELHITNDEKILFYLWYSMKKYKNAKVSCTSERICISTKINILEKDMKMDKLLYIYHKLEGDYDTKKNFRYR